MIMNTQIDLTAFCSKDSGRYSFQEPFVIGGFVYATDGRVMVRMPTTSPEDPAIDKSIPKKAAPELFDGFEAIESTSWPAGQIVQFNSKCSACCGTGLESIRCGDCNGTGKLECDLGHTHDCDHCSGNGRYAIQDSEACPSCDGSGKTVAVKFDQDAFIRLENNSRISELPGVRLVGARKSEIWITKTTALKFEFDGGEGIVSLTDRETLST